MNKKILILLCTLFFGFGIASAQEVQKSDLQQRAENEDANGHVATARYLYIKAFDEYSDQGKLEQGIPCAAQAAGMYYKENYYREAFDLLRRADQVVTNKVTVSSQANALHYQLTKVRLQMYMKLHRSASAQEQLNIMERQVDAAEDEKLKDDLLYNKAIFYYTFGQNERGNAVFQEMSDRMTASEDYNKVDEVYQTLIESGRRAGNASMVSLAYSNYTEWKDSVTAIKHAKEVDALKQQIATHEATIADKDSSLSSRSTVIVGLSILAAILAAVLVLGALAFMRVIAVNRKQKNTIKEERENNALKARFINNIAAQLTPTLQKLDGKNAEVKALRDFAEHVQTLASLDSTANESVELEDIQVQPFCESLLEEIRGKVKKDVELISKAPKMSAKVNKEYVTHILRHLLNNAAVFTPEGGHITLDFKKRSAHTQQFLVYNTGSDIPEEKRNDVFKPFLEVKDLSTGDGLGLPICRQMALKMDGDLSIDPTFSKGTRFVLDLHI